MIQESRHLYKCKKAGIDTPALYYIDTDTATIYMEYIAGITVKQRLLDNQQSLYESIDINQLGLQIGQSLAKMHSLNIIHGDLTTSNLMIRDSHQSLVIIDFGLSYTSALIEDKAVDLYVLERAFTSTHPHTETLFAIILENYASSYAQSKTVLKKLEDVRLRGRKRSMIG